MPADITSLDKKQNADNELVGMEEAGGVHHIRVIPATSVENGTKTIEIRIRILSHNSAGSVFVDEMELSVMTEPEQGKYEEGNNKQEDLRDEAFDHAGQDRFRNAHPAAGAG